MAPTASASQMVQLNLRVNAQDKRNAEEVLRLMGTTTTEFIRKVLAKVAGGAKEYAELMGAIEEPITASEEAQEKEELCPLLAEAKRIGDDFAHMLGYDSVDSLPKDDRPWEEIYEEGMLAHYREKGWLS